VDSGGSLSRSWTVSLHGFYASFEAVLYTVYGLGFEIYQRAFVNVCNHVCRVFAATQSCAAPPLSSANAQHQSSGQAFTVRAEPAYPL